VLLAAGSMASHGLALGASRVEEVIAALTATVERQAAELDALRAELASRPTHGDLAAVRDAAHAGIAAVEGRAAALEAALNAPSLGDPGVAGGATTPGAALEWMFRAVPELQARADAAATAAALSRAVDELRREAALTSAELDDAKASKTAVSA
jgi:hypothetical protein